MQAGMTWPPCNGIGLQEASSAHSTWGFTLPHLKTLLSPPGIPPGSPGSVLAARCDDQGTQSQNQQGKCTSVETGRHSTVLGPPLYVPPSLLSQLLFH